MGIPSYFSYIVKNHAHLIKKIDHYNMSINNLYMDCNSIIYDAYNKLATDNMLNDNVANQIIICVIEKIKQYISLLKPDGIIFIAFDGVAPVAKLEQQRSRRYKSLYQSTIIKTIKKTTTPDVWSTTAITPGTVFMRELNERVGAEFNDQQRTYGVKRILFSGSDECGEGEHKIFEYIRTFPEYHKPGVNTVIYGLDADLIMLSINHLPVSPNIYLFRETPHFIQSINRDLEPNANYIMDIPELAKIITDNMNNNGVTDTNIVCNRIYDYIFLCFFLGNDFMPHFPSVNIRTGGVDKMLNAYKATIGGTNEILTDGKTIYWKNVRKLVQHLASFEEDYFKGEAKLRDRREKQSLPESTPEEKIKKFDSLPTYERSAEKFINPYKPNWQYRYYKSLFNIEIDEQRKQQICTNFLQALEWNMKYYTSGCPDWRWQYNYNYPPLFQDLIHYIPYFETVMVENKRENPVTELVQLCYVLPRQSLQLLPQKLYSALIKEHIEWYKTDCEFVWAYSRYFWESHVCLPDIDIGELELFVSKHK